MDSLATFGMLSSLLTETASYSGKCDGCGASRGAIMKLSLGRDFSAGCMTGSRRSDTSPKWYCDAVQSKRLQRDFRDIQMEFARLRKGEPPPLTSPSKASSYAG